MIGLEKLSTLGMEGSGGGLGSLFLKTISFLQEKKKLVSLNSDGSGSIGCLDRNEKFLL